MVKYYELVTDMTIEELEVLKAGLEAGTMHPRDAKMKLAYTLVRMYHDVGAAEAAQEHFITVFQQRALPDDIEEVRIDGSELEDGQIRMIKLLTLIGFAASNGEAKRSIQQGSVKLNEEKVADSNDSIAIKNGDIIQMGKRKFAKLIIEV